jgi:Tol biopolymer transport system component
MFRLFPLLFVLAFILSTATPAEAQGSCNPSQLLTPVSVAMDGSIVGGGEPRISEDGRYIAFIGGNDLVPNDTNPWSDVFVYDRYTCQTTLASYREDGTQFTNSSPTQLALSADGRSVAFSLLDLDSRLQTIYTYNLTTQQSLLVTKGYDGSPVNGDSHDPAISGDGRYIAFNSTASNLVPNDTNDVSDVFVYDRQADTVTRVSVGPNGEQGDDESGRSWLQLRWGTAISADGRYVAFNTRAGNFIAEMVGNDEPLMLLDRQTGQMIIYNTIATFPRFSQGGLSLTYNMMLVEAFNPSPEEILVPLLPLVVRVHVHNLQTGVKKHVSVSSDGVNANRFSYSGGTSSDGRFTVYTTNATNLVADDTNGKTDVFLYDLDTATTRRISVNVDGSQLPHESINPDISGNGHYVVFQTVTTPGQPGGLPAGVYVLNLLHLLTSPTQLMTNGDFSAGMANWGTWDAITHQLSNGVFEFYRNARGVSAVVLQATGAALPANAPLTASFELGNTSPVRKRITAIIHDSDWSDQMVCSFWVPPNTPLRIYTMTTATTEAWTDATFSFYGSPAENIGWIQLDNVSLIHDPTLALEATRCFDPSAP